MADDRRTHVVEAIRSSDALAFNHADRFPVIQVKVLDKQVADALEAYLKEHTTARDIDTQYNPIQRGWVVQIGLEDAANAKLLPEGVTAKNASNKLPAKSKNSFGFAAPQAQTPQAEAAIEWQDWQRKRLHARLNKEHYTVSIEGNRLVLDPPLGARLEVAARDALLLADMEGRDILLNFSGKKLTVTPGKEGERLDHRVDDVIERHRAQAFQAEAQQRAQAERAADLKELHARLNKEHYTVSTEGDRLVLNPPSGARLEVAARDALLLADMEGREILLNFSEKKVTVTPGKEGERLVHRVDDVIERHKTQRAGERPGHQAFSSVRDVLNDIYSMQDDPIRSAERTARIKEWIKTAGSDDLAKVLGETIGTRHEEFAVEILQTRKAALSTGAIQAALQARANWGDVYFKRLELAHHQRFENYASTVFPFDPYT